MDWSENRTGIGITRTVFDPQTGTPLRSGPQDIREIDQVSSVSNRLKKKDSPTGCSQGLRARMWLSAWSSQTLR
jgi:hypothetical protein